MRKILLAFSIVILLVLPCCKDNPVDGGKPPCLDCPFNFRLIDFYPAWSPDGKTIAYVHGDTEAGKTGIYLVDTSGSNKKIIHVSAGAYSPAWSPDGKWIAFSDQAQIWKMKINGDSLTQLTSIGRNFFPTWSPDGNWISYDRSLADESGPAGIWVMKFDGTEKKQIFGGAFPDWNNNGNILIAVIGTAPTSIWTRFLLFDFSHSKSIDTLNAVVGANNQFPKYSSDGTKIAFTSQPNGGKSQIWVINSDDTNPRQLTTIQGYSCDWSPRSDWIIYTNSDTTSGKLWLIRSNGSGNHSLRY